MPARSAVRRLAVGRVISLAGSAAAFTALVFTIYQRTRSPTWLAVTLLLTFGVAGIFGPFAGALGDRFDRRKVMLASDLAGAICFFAMAFVRAPAALVAMGGLASLLELPFLSASGAAIPNLVDDKDDVSWANSWVGIGRNAGITIGPLFGGVLLATIGASWVFAGNAVTFLVSFALVWTIRRDFSGARGAEEVEEYRGIAAGLAFVARDRVLRTITLAWTVAVIGLGMGLVADLLIAELFHAGSAGYGAIIAFWGLGSVVGSFLGRRLDATTERLWLVLGTAIIGVTCLGVGLTPVFWPVLAFSLGFGIADGVTLVAEQGIKQRTTPDAVRSRVMAATEAVMQIGLAIGYLIAGFALDRFGAQGVYLIVAVGMVAAAVLMLPILPGRARRGEEEPAADDVGPATG